MYRIRRITSSLGTPLFRRLDSMVSTSATTPAPPVRTPPPLLRLYSSMKTAATPPAGKLVDIYKVVKRVEEVKFPKEQSEQITYLLQLGWEQLMIKRLEEVNLPRKQAEQITYVIQYCFDQMERELDKALNEFYDNSLDLNFSYFSDPASSLICAYRRSLVRLHSMKTAATPEGDDDDDDDGDCWLKGPKIDDTFKVVVFKLQEEVKFPIKQAEQITYVIQYGLEQLERKLEEKLDYYWKLCIYKDSENLKVYLDYVSQLLELKRPYYETERSFSWYSLLANLKGLRIDKDKMVKRLEEVEFPPKQADQITNVLSNVLHNGSVQLWRKLLGLEQQEQLVQKLEEKKDLDSKKLDLDLKNIDSDFDLKHKASKKQNLDSDFEFEACFEEAEHRLGDSDFDLKHKASKKRNWWTSFLEQW